MYIFTRKKNKAPRGLIAFFVNKDMDLITLDLNLVGMRLIKPRLYYRYQTYYRQERIINDAQAIISSSIKNLYYSTYLCYYRSRFMLCRLYYDSVNTNRVRVILFITFNKGMISLLFRSLEKQGWKKIVSVEILTKKLFSGY